MTAAGDALARLASPAAAAIITADPNAQIGTNCERQCLHGPGHGIQLNQDFPDRNGLNHFSFFRLPGHDLF